MTVIGRSLVKGKWVVRFGRTGGVAESTLRHIKTGSVKDPKARTIAGVGYIDGYKTRAPRRPYYALWVSMLRRCYDLKNQDYPRYGGRGVTVCDRWHSLKNFAADVAGLPNHDRWAVGEGFHFDKDIRIPGNKQYRPEACWFVDAKLNVATARSHPISVNGRCFRSVQAAAGYFGVHRSTLMKWLAKTRREDLVVASLLPRHPFLRTGK